jgi:hypothetical protein
MKKSFMRSSEGAAVAAQRNHRFASFIEDRKCKKKGKTKEKKETSGKMTNVPRGDK